MKIALVHDQLTAMTGAERVLTNFLEIFNDAPIYTSVCNRENLDGILKEAQIITSYVQSEGIPEDNKELLGLMPAAFESINLKEYDVILSSCFFGSKGVITAPNALHICYCHSPIIYEIDSNYNKDFVSDVRKGTSINFMTAMRMWDFLAANRVDYFIVNSESTARKVWKYYKRKSMIINPPVRSDFFNISDVDEDYFLVVSRLDDFKRIDLAIEAFNELGLPLVIIGEGPLRSLLESKAKANIKFLGKQNDEVVKEYYGRCRAFIFPGEDDFGIAPLEAQASGRPVVAYGEGGVLETIIEGETGVFFNEQSPKSLIDAIKRFESLVFDKQRIRAHAEEFNEEMFKIRIKNFVQNKFKESDLDRHWYKL